MRLLLVYLFNHGYRFDLHLETRLEYLTLAVGNAKSHPISIGGRHETAIAFLTDLEERLEVAQVQLEIYNTLLPHINDSPEAGERINRLSKSLFNMSEVRHTFLVRISSNQCIRISSMKIMLLHLTFRQLNCYACTFLSLVIVN